MWPRDQKAIPISPQMATALGIDPAVDVLSPPELMRAILLAPVDLLWNGGIGTYIKASTESNPEVGDKANDSIRVDGNEVRATVVGEGGNLGVTELGRIEFDLAGGRINTDAMDNSAGVDCSDHEVNIKVLLDTAVGSGKLPAGQRDSLLSSMTDEVAELVLADNIAQNAELGFSRAYALERVEVHARMLASLAERGVDLRLESLPTAAALRKRVHGETGRALTSPELATMMAHVKLLAKSDLLAGDLVDNDVFDDRLARYFPEPLRSAYADELRTHRLRREIVATTLVNEVVAHIGVTHLFRLTEGAAVGAEDGVRAFVVVNKVFGMREVFDSISAAPVDVKTVDEMLSYAAPDVPGIALVAGRASQPLAVASEITRYATRVAQLSPLLPGWFGASSARDVDERTAAYRDARVRGDRASSRDQSASLLPARHHRRGRISESLSPRSARSTSRSWNTSASSDCSPRSANSTTETAGMPWRAWHYVTTCTPRCGRSPSRSSSTVHRGVARRYDQRVVALTIVPAGAGAVDARRDRGVGNTRSRDAVGGHSSAA